MVDRTKVDRSSWKGLRESVDLAIGLSSIVAARLASLIRIANAHTHL
jgi:hypothetical protein